MNAPETLMLLEWLALIDPRYGTGGDDAKLALKAKAWHDQIPVGITLQEAQDIATGLMERGETVTAPAIRRRYRERRTPLHALAHGALDWAPTPVQPNPPQQPVAATRAPAAIDPGKRPLDGPATSEAIKRLGLLPSGRNRAALTVACPYCRQPVGKPCVTGNGKPLTRQPGHPSRITLAGAAPS